MNKTALLVTGVVVVGAGGYLVYAKNKGMWPFASAGGGVSPPGAPSSPGQPQVSVNVTGQSTAEADVSWSPVSGASYYKVFVNGQEVISSVSGTTARITGLVPGNSYQVSVAACN